jgi:broad specificity phosphatase PhoE
MSKRYLYLVRHGQYNTGDKSDKLEGGLTEIGWEQARLTALRLAEYPVNRLHHSSLRRATETATALSRELPTVHMQAARVLWECVPCIPSSFSEYFTDVPAALVEQHGRQAQRAYQRYFKPPGRRDSHEIIVCHGNIICYLICRALGVPATAWMNTDIRNCGISEVVIFSDGWTRVLSHNDTGHLPKALRTFV